MNPQKGLMRRSLANLNHAAPVALDTAGIILLSGSAMLLHVAAGIAVAGCGCFFLNWRIYDR